MKTCIFVTMNCTPKHTSISTSIRYRMILPFFFILMAYFPNILHSQGGTPLFGVINSYARVTKYHSCSKSVEVVGLSGFEPKKKVMMIQMDGADIDTSNTASFGSVINYGNAGNAEILEIESIVGSSIVFKHAPLMQYDPENGSVQLVTIPTYDTALVSIMRPLTCSPWNGSTGGVLAFEVRLALDVAGTIDVSGKGFEGGRVRNAASGAYSITDYALPNDKASLAGEKGRGIAILKPEYLLGRGAPANAGGGGNAHNSGGGGGANGGRGGIGSKDFPDGLIHNGGDPGRENPYQQFIDDSLPRIFLGGGGGSGHVNNNAAFPGGNGGGIVYIRSNNFVIRPGARIFSNGANVGGPKTGNSNDGYGGGGGGGSIYFDVNRFISFGNEIQIEAKGGKGGITGASKHGPGGGGGGGIVMFNGNIPNRSIIDISGGQPGENLIEKSSLGAEAGADGLILGNVRLIESNKGVMAIAVSKDTAVCEKSEVQLSVKPLGGKPPYTYQWTGSNITDPSARSTTARPNQDDSYRVIVTDANGCTNFAFIKVTVYPSPSLNLPVNRRTACKGDTIILQANSGQFLTWLPADGLLENTGNRVRCIADSTRTYTIFAETQSGCSAIDTIRIDVEEAPKMMSIERAFELCPEDDSVRIPRSFIFGSNSPYTVQWFTNTDTLSTDSIFTQINVKPIRTTAYFMEFSTPYGCTYRDSVLVTINPSPTISLSNDTVICKGSSVQLFASGGTQYEWSPTFGLSDKTIANPIASPATTTMYMVTVTSAKGCIAKDSITITVADSPIKPILSRSNDTVFVKGDGSRYEWLLNGKTISNGQDSLLVIDSSGYYSVIARNTYCETYSDSLFVSIGYASIQLDSITLNNNEIADMRIRLLDTSAIQESGIVGIECSLTWNATVAEVTHPGFTKLTGKDMQTATLSLPISSLPVLGTLRIRGLLGNAPKTGVVIDGIKPIGGLLRLNIINGNVNIGDICYEGGVRLWHADKNVAKARIIVNPHPIEAGSEIRLDIPEQGHFTLNAYSANGMKLPIASGFTLPGTIVTTFPFEACSSGMYTLKLETPTESVTLPIILNK